MKRKILVSVLVIFLLPVLFGYDSPRFDDKYDVYPDAIGFTHCLQPITGQIAKHKFALVVKNGESKQVFFYDCPEGLVYSCRVNSCVFPGSKEDCDCK